MGKMENRWRASKNQLAVLNVIKAVGVIGVALLAPNALQMFKLLNNKATRAKTRSLYSARDRLIKKGFVKNDEGYLELTKIRIGPGLLYIIADQIENDSKIKHAFRI